MSLSNTHFQVTVSLRDHEAVKKLYSRKTSKWLVGRMVAKIGLTWNPAFPGRIPSQACHYRWLLNQLALVSAYTHEPFRPWVAKKVEPHPFDFSPQTYGIRVPLKTALREACNLWGITMSELAQEVLEDELLPPAARAVKLNWWKKLWEGDGKEGSRGVQDRCRELALTTMHAISDKMKLIPCPSPFTGEMFAPTILTADPVVAPAEPVLQALSPEAAAMLAKRRERINERNAAHNKSVRKGGYDDEP